jgi:UDP-N-acetylmuramoyl-L-alanyl-D-glutamate--2,6-diaminopimelate ligase
MNNCLILSKKIKDSKFLQLPSIETLKGLTFDSREVKIGYAFFSFQGIHTNGDLFIDNAIEKGATLIVCETSPLTLVEGIGYLIVKSSRTAFAIFNSYFYDRADKKLKIIGISGTDGKTTTSCYLYNLLKMNKIKCGLLSTVYQDDGSKLVKSKNRQSTPEANTLHSFFSDCISNNVEYVILEATSHSLSPQMDRLNNIKFDHCIITNITSEHLELHKSIENYVDAKCNLIRKLKQNGTFISTLDNIHLAECLKAAKDHKTFILKKDLEYKLIKDSGLKSFKVEVADKIYNTNLHLDVFVSNALLACIACSIITKTPLDNSLKDIQNLMSINGRFDIIKSSLPFTCIVDFAHTADALYHIMSSVKPTGARLIAVFGSGGERDIIKRKQMGRVASTFCDIIIITEEDPRGESNLKIASDIKVGIDSTKCYIIDDRLSAINKAIDIAKKNDILLFLGKGHESSIQRRFEQIPWNEASAVSAALHKRELNYVENK